MGSLMGFSTEGEEEEPTAGMEVTLAGVQLRPIIFFSGQGDLMGHVWSGTASERTTALQVNYILSFRFLINSFFLHINIGLPFINRQPCCFRIIVKLYRSKVDLSPYLTCVGLSLLILVVKSKSVFGAETLIRLLKTCNFIYVNLVS